jgi:hypothetical protein
MGYTNEIQNQIFPLKITHDSYNHGGHRPPSFDWKLKIVHGSLLL